MAPIIGTVKSVANGTFYVKDSKGYIHQIKVGESIHEGDLIFGAPTNMADAQIVVDILLAGAGDLVISQNGSLTFDTSVLQGVFSHQDAVVHVNSMEEALSMAGMSQEEMANKMEIATVAQGTKGGDETAAGTEVTDSERVGDVFYTPDGMVTNVSTEVYPATAGTATAAITAPTEAIRTETVTAETVTPPPPSPPPPVGGESNALILDVRLGEVDIQSNSVPVQSPSAAFSAIGAEHTYTDENGKLILDGGNVPSVGATVHFNPGNGYGVTSDGESSVGIQRIDTTGTNPEALILDMDKNLVSLDIEIKHPKQEVQQDAEGVKWEAYDRNGNLVGTDTLYITDNDALHTVTITPNLVDDGSFQYVVFLGTVDGYYVSEIGNGTAVDYTYSYPLHIIDASLGNGNGVLGDIMVSFSDMPEGGILTHPSYDPISVPSDGAVSFGSDTDPTSWTLTLDSELPEESSIIASLTSVDTDGSTATAYVGVYGDNTIIGSAGDDSFDGRDGSDSLSGMGGNDTFIFGSDDSLVDGGTGTDTLILTGNTSIDFENWDSGSLKSIEVIDLTSGDHALSNLSFEDVVNMTDGNNNLYILGDAGDSVDFLNNDSWVISADTVVQSVNGVDHTFDVYVNTQDPTVMVHVEQVITDTIA